MFRKSSLLRATFLGLMLLAAASSSASAGEATPDQPTATSTSRVTMHDFAQRLLRLLEGRWMPADRNFDKPYV